ncbi:MAG: hypothetical protein ACRD3B_02700 [Candidatus Sulfotelmatobacter sp.]
MSLARPIHGALESMNHRLNLYSVAALTAGVSLLALAKPAEGSVVVTKTNISLTNGGQASIDINKDGTNDFFLSVGAGGYDHSFYATFAVTPLAGGKVTGGNSRGVLGPYASALAKGANVGPSAHFSSSVGRERIIVERTAGFVSGSSGHSSYGKWGNVSNRYLGVKFLIKGQTHYGWIRLSVQWTHGLTATITAYAYETVANKKIGGGNAPDAPVSTDASVVPLGNSKRKGPSIGLLALGSDGLAAWRRE